jgi:hypothetical protein
MVLVSTDSPDPLHLIGTVLDVSKSQSKFSFLHRAPPPSTPEPRTRVPPLRKTKQQRRGETEMAGSHGGLLKREKNLVICTCVSKG